MQTWGAAAELEHLSLENRDFVDAFDAAMGRAGYDCGGRIGPGYCWGRHMMIYRKTGAKSQSVAARIYIRDDGVSLRLFLNGVDKHRAFLENASAHVLEPFLNDHGRCNHCHNQGRIGEQCPQGTTSQKADGCRFRKSYTLFGQSIDKCNGITFEYRAPQAEYLDEYMALLAEFYPRRGRG